MANKTKMLRKCLSVCQEIETVASQIYHFHADRFAASKQIAHLWRRTALEEEYHACQVMLTRRQVDSILCPELDISQAESTRNLCRALFEAIKKTPPTLEEAILTAIELEERLAQLHMETEMTFENNGGIYLFRGLMMEDIRHIEELEGALRKLPSRSLRAA